ncbi:MAG: LysR family transcriptional regulator, partial [Shewanella sp.]
MDTDLLKTFLEVSRTRHFGKAAENLYLTRSAVSFRVKQLESILGVALFERQRNNIQPT